MFLGAESLQDRNKISASSVCRIVSCILQNEKLTEVLFDLSPFDCARHEAWRSEGLPSLNNQLKADVRDDWRSVLVYLRQV